MRRIALSAGAAFVVGAALCLTTAPDAGAAGFRDAGQAFVPRDVQLAADRVLLAAASDDLLSGSGSSGGDDLLSGSGSSGGDDLLSGSKSSGGDDLLSGKSSNGGDDLLSGSKSSGGDDLLSGSGSSGSDDLLTGTGSGGGDDLLSGGSSSGGDSLLTGTPSTGGDGLLTGGDGGGGDNLLSPDLFGAPTSAPKTEKAVTETEKPTPAEMHQAAFENAGDRYPSANECATCHPRQYRQWSVSQHAYAQLSPVYMAMQITINSKTAGTNGDFCIRCHNQVGMNLGESIYVSNLERNPTSREGITCVVCHRVNQAFGKVSGRLPLNEGDLFSTIYGPKGGKELERVLENPQEYRVVTDREESGRGIHTKAQRFFQLTEPSFCGTCHDVTLFNGFRLEEAFAEYQQSEAADNGVTCQDCHMGKEQGVPSGYDEGPAAIVGDTPTRDRKLTNHFFAGPDYPIIHRGIFPHNVEAANFKTLREWLQFDNEAGWGTDAFENTVSPDYEFPAAWVSIDDRYDAREILNEQDSRLEWAAQQRMQVLRNGFKLGDIRLVRAGVDGLEFKVDVRNGTNGHGVPTGFDAERLIFLQVEVKDADGKLLYVSGDRDPNGDVRDSHSLFVHDGELPLDEDLFTLQTKFVVRMERGGEREEVLALNHSFSPQPFVRPETRATTIFGRPRSARKDKQTIQPLGKKTATYRVDGSELSGDGPYTVNVKLISQAVPVNLIAAIQGVGFDYGMSPKEIAERVVEGASTLWEREITVDPATGSVLSATEPHSDQQASLPWKLGSSGIAVQ